MRSLCFIFAVVLHTTAAVRFERVPHKGIQPQLERGPDGSIHLIYFKGDPMGGDIFYVRKSSPEGTFSSPIQVNSRPGSAIAAGTMRGPQMALGRNGRVHVAWMGGNGAAKAMLNGEGTTPMLYARLNEAGDAFEPERNLVRKAGGLDGGGTVAADDLGQVLVLWHGHPPGVEGEENRGLYVARSNDEGKTFALEERAEMGGGGSCACCGVKARLDQAGNLHVLFRIAREGYHRNELWLKSADFGKTFEVLREDPWRVGTCPASSASLSPAGLRMVGAWESEHGIHAGLFDKGAITAIAAPSNGARQKFPGITADEQGELLLTWVEGAAWGGKGKLRWLIFSDGQPTGETGTVQEVPSWSFAASYPDGQGGFVVVY